MASRVHRLAELRKRQHTPQVQVAEAMGVTQARVSRMRRASSSAARSTRLPPTSRHSEAR
ncbi:helix-turn-helix domain-containing protein [Streptomyces sp. NPDC096013]|uniref:helix-turn-helix domain-containing protein n=1 Tax=Streptomyces sp. NPDC096013 TaxID=3366069 RepID=UPI0037F3EAA2